MPMAERNWKPTAGSVYRAATGDAVQAEQSCYNQMAKRGAEILPFGAGAGGSVHGHGLMYGRDSGPLARRAG